ncbi:MAG: Fe-S cluster assembly protein SufB, partial [Candidatus Hydrothermae bacterium]|nr:Fe-S cluster assembly protein SufB [Candidatus Hydrothermae bacterium]
MAEKPNIQVDLQKYDFKDPEQYVYKTPKGLSRRIVEEISHIKEEPDWMREIRLKAYDHFVRRPLPTWGADLSGIDFDEI